MSVTIIRLAALSAAIAGSAGIAAAQAPPPPVELRSAFTIAQSCEDQVEAGDIVVCARPGEDERYRLPLRDQQSPVVGSAFAPGDFPRANADPSWPADCGIYDHQRRCSRREMTEFGYHNGRNPFAAFSTIAETLDEPK